METNGYPKINVEVADNFYTDAVDLLDRFDRTFEFYFALKSRRFKCYNDLRTAYECCLKSIIAYNQPGNGDRKTIIALVEKCGHKITQLETHLQGADGAKEFEVASWGNDLDDLPVGLRYTLDGYDFIAANESLYYRTIGDDDWIDSLKKYVGTLCHLIGEELANYSGLLKVSDVPIEKILGNEFNKYRS